MMMQSIIRLLKSCPKLTHLSLTGVQAFLRSEFEQFCREAPRGKSFTGFSCLYHINVS